MSYIPLTPQLKQEYNTLFNTCTIRADKAAEFEKLVTAVKTNKQRYAAVAAAVNIPWYFIAVVHQMESSGSFKAHLHNGDPLSARTYHVPAGRPLSGNPPFTWEESAVDALKLEQLNLWQDWSLGGLLYKIEGYNGFGYRKKHPAVKSPYLWSYSNHYTMGKYVQDGKWSDTAVSKQCGAAVILKKLSETETIGIPEIPGGTIVPVSAAPMIIYSSTEVPYAKELQLFLNKVTGSNLTVDGKPGKNTSDAVQKVFGSYLQGDPRKETVPA